MRILPVSALAARAQVVKHAVLVEVVVEIELGGRLSEHGRRVHSLRWSRVDSLSAHRVQEWLTSHTVHISVEGVLKELGSEGLFSGAAAKRAISDAIVTAHVVRREPHLVLVDLIETFVSLAGISLLHVHRLGRSAVRTGGSLMGGACQETSRAGHA